MLQQHIVPHIGETAAFRYLPESDRTNRVAAPPPYSNNLQREAMAVVQRMSNLNETKKIQVEQFDSKVLILTAICDAFVNKVMEGCDELDFPPPVEQEILSVERYAHFLQTIMAVEYDSLIILIKEKIRYDLVRPTTVIQAMGNRQITTWCKGDGGVRRFPAADFETYIPVAPHSEYVSGSACIFETVKETVRLYLKRIGIDDTTNFPIVFPRVPIMQSKVEPGITPMKAITLQYSNADTMAVEGCNSRLDGGMNFEGSIPAGQQLCAGIAAIAVEKSFKLYE